MGREEGRSYPANTTLLLPRIAHQLGIVMAHTAHPGHLACLQKEAEFQEGMIWPIAYSWSAAGRICEQAAAAPVTGNYLCSYIITVPIERLPVVISAPSHHPKHCHFHPGHLERGSKQPVCLSVHRALCQGPQAALDKSRKL